MKRVSCFYVLFLLCFNLSANQLDTLVVKRKADFIVKVGERISFPAATGFSTYKIALYGRSRELNELFKELKNRESQLEIHGKPLEVLHFKRMKQVEPVDLLYVSGTSKIRISSLNEQLKGHPYVILTENFPFGTSILNMHLDKNREIFFTIEPNVLRSNGAVIEQSLLDDTSRITSAAEWAQLLAAARKEVEKQKEQITAQKEELSKHKEIITDQQEDIEEKEETINYQRAFISIMIGAVVIISGLGVVLLRVNQLRKAALTEVRLKNEDIIASITAAKRIQDSILPSTQLLNKYFVDSFVWYQPKDIVSGDFYWMEEEGDYLFFAVADCTGHGVPGAMVSVMCSNLLTKIVKELQVKQPNKMLDLAVALLEKSFAKSDVEMTDGMDIAICSYHKASRELNYAGAYNSLYLVRAQQMQVIKATRQPVGKHLKPKPFENHQVMMQAGDQLYLFSDGLVDQFGGPDNKKFMPKQFRKLLLDHHQETMSAQKMALEQAFLHWKGDLPQVDDICVMGVKI
ncbi:MAG: YfiR/HmsC family protein [Flammeovirgaceae bacterium]